MHLKKGAEFEGSLDAEDLVAKFKFNAAYLEVPVLVKLAIESSSKTQLTSWLAQPLDSF